MILISHRGNINGPIKERENDPSYIEYALSLGYDVEIDIHYVNEELWLGHDEPTYKTNFNWLYEKRLKLWVHCKDISSMVLFNSNLYGNSINYFWHDTDKVALTSKGYLWAYPGNQPIKNSIAVMPELENDNTEAALGICSDFIGTFK
jgi:hypothetical protein